MQEAGIWKKWYLRIQADRLLEAERHLQDQVDFILSISLVMYLPTDSILQRKDSIPANGI